MKGWKGWLGFLGWGVDGVDVASVEPASGGWWFPSPPRKTKEDVRRERIAFGILPPDKQEKIEKAVAVVASKAPELDQKRAEDLFVSVYLSVYPELERQRLLEELAYQTYLMEEQDFVIFLSAL